MKEINIEEAKKQKIITLKKINEEKDKQKIKTIIELVIKDNEEKIKKINNPTKENLNEINQRYSLLLSKQ